MIFSSLDHIIKEEKESVSNGNQFWLPSNSLINSCMKLTKSRWWRCVVNIKRHLLTLELVPALNANFSSISLPSSTAHNSCITLFDIIIHKYVFNALNGNWFDENMKEREEEDWSGCACMHTFSIFEGWWDMEADFTCEHI